KIFGQGISSFIGLAASRQCQSVSRSTWPRNIPKPMLESAASRTTYHFENDRKNMPADTTRRCLLTLVRSTRTHLINRERVRGWRIGAAAVLLVGHRTLRLCSFVAPCQPPRQSLAHSFLIYERGSNARGSLYCRFDCTGHRTGASGRCDFIPAFGWNMARSSARHSISR